MRKNELIHLHALLGCVLADLEERGEVRTDRLRKYEALKVTPMSVQESCERHEVALRTLSGAIMDSLAESDASGEEERSSEPNRQTA